METVVLYVNDKDDRGYEPHSGKPLKVPDLGEGYRSLVENAMEIIFTLSPNGKFTYINPAYEEYSGFSSKDLIGKSFISIMHSDYLPLVSDVLIKSPNLQAQDWQIKTKDDSEVIIEFKTTPLLKDNKVTGILGFGRDVTQRKKAEEQSCNHQKQLEQLASEIIVIEKRERRKLAAYLHDKIGQTLSACKLKLQHLLVDNEFKDEENIGKDVVNHIGQTIKDVRSMMIDLSPPILHELGLETALEWLAGKEQNASDLTIEFKDDKQVKPVDENIRDILFNSTQELIKNIIKHAKATHAEISIKKEDQMFRIDVKDNGTGRAKLFIDYKGEKLNGYGLFSIRERLKLFGGIMEISSNPDEGSQISIMAPLSCDNTSQPNLYSGETLL